MKALNYMAIVAAVLLLAVSSQAVSANAYTGYNTIGGYQQYNVAYGNYGSGYHYSTGPVYGGTLTYPNSYYNYPTTPRLGGNFGSWYLTGLRTPTYYCVTPTHYASGYRQTCGSSYSWGTYGGGYGGNYGGFSGSYGGYNTPVRSNYGFY